MKRRNFIHSSLLTTSAIAAGQLAFAAPEDRTGKKELYELREYEIHFGGNANTLHQYFEKALIPALNKYGRKIRGRF